MLPRRQFLQSLTATATIAVPLASVQAKSATKQLMIIAGPTNHPPGTHEIDASGRLLKHCLENMTNLAGLSVSLHSQWPDRKQLDAVDAMLFVGDIFPPMRMPNSKEIMQDLGQMMDRGCGIACIHYATGLSNGDVASDGEHPLLHWMGGYFATKCPHHQSIARVFPQATISPSPSQHPILRGWKEFTLHDEPYINNYFGPVDNQPKKNVTVLATSLLPPESPKSEPVAWCVERKDGGRGFAIVMPHFYRNWQQEDLRRFILNGVVWSTGIDIPDEGVMTQLTDLAKFEPMSIDPVKPLPAKT
jgi:type 1 glutamine amidotransferase